MRDFRLYCANETKKHSKKYELDVNGVNKKMPSLFLFVFEIYSLREFAMLAEQPSPPKKTKNGCRWGIRFCLGNNPNYDTKEVTFE